MCAWYSMQFNHSQRYKLIITRPYTCWPWPEERNILRLSQRGHHPYDDVTRPHTAGHQTHVQWAVEIMRQEDKGHRIEERQHHEGPHSDGEGPDNVGDVPQRSGSSCYEEVSRLEKRRVGHVVLVGVEEWDLEQRGVHVQVAVLILRRMIIVKRTLGSG